MSETIELRIKRLRDGLSTLEVLERMATAEGRSMANMAERLIETNPTFMQFRAKVEGIHAKA